jgi:hypothetical protein
VQLIALLAAGRSYDECCKLLRVSKRTIVRLNADKEFGALVRASRATLLEQTVGLLAAEATSTVRTLLELRDHGSESARLGAARTLLEKVASLREHVDLEMRMSALERALSLQRVKSGVTTDEHATSRAT